MYIGHTIGLKAMTSLVSGRAGGGDIQAISLLFAAPPLALCELLGKHLALAEL